MTDDEDFDEWMDEVNIAVHDAAGLRALDFPDQDYRAWYADGVSPAEAASMIFEAGP
jgi:hypothetical protein